jgi:DNA-directed RNA polymerase sigma subunit (sigma70/sigma32)
MVTAIRATIKTASSTVKVSTPGKMGQSIQASSRTATKLAWANGLSSILSQQARKELQFTKVASKMIANMDLEQSFGQQEEGMMGNLVKTKDTAMEKCSMATAQPTKAIGQEDSKTASESR